MTSDPLLAIGDVARRCGIAVSAVRFYEQQGLIHAERTDAGHRRFRRSTIRRVSFVIACQRLGYHLDEIARALDQLPDNRTPNDNDWARLGRTFRQHLDERIAGLEALRDTLDGCIGCGCLSLERCALYNPTDRAATLGHGPRYLLGNTSDDILNAPEPPNDE